jgi:predicted nucleic acid-binding protein
MPNISSAPNIVEQYRNYWDWAAKQSISLRQVMTVETVNQLFLTSSFEVIKEFNQAAAGTTAISSLLFSELVRIEERFKAAESELEAEVAKWTRRMGALTSRSWPHIAVLDTNVLMRHSTTLKDLTWREVLDTREGQTIALVIPYAVILELDNLKFASGTMQGTQGADGKELSRRDVARRALNQIELWFPGDRDVTHLASLPGGLPTEIYLALQVDELSHVPLATADREIIEQARRLRPFSSSLKVVTGDTSMRVLSEHAGVSAVELPVA